jgi:hypothetical protein
MEEFGCVVHCGYEFNSSAVEPTLMRIEQGLGGVDEAASLRAKIDDLQGQLDRELAAGQATKSLHEALDKSDEPITTAILDLLRDWRTVDRYARELAWERECNRRATEEIAEARYWARRLYQEEVAADMLLYMPVPSWVMWVDKGAE